MTPREHGYRAGNLWLQACKVVGRTPTDDEFAAALKMAHSHWKRGLLLNVEDFIALLGNSLSNSQSEGV